MSWDYDNDAEPDESYSAYIARKKAEYHSSRLVIVFFSLFFNVLTALVVYSPLFYIGYILAKKVDAASQTSLYIFAILFVYVLYSFIFFLKGLLIALKQKRNRLWILLWVFCVTATCLIPMLIAEQFIEMLFKPDTRMLFKNQLIAWICSLLFGLFVYHRYNLKRQLLQKWCGGVFH